MPAEIAAFRFHPCSKSQKNLLTEVDDREKPSILLLVLT